MFVLDLHVHSCLSPCAGLDMHPAQLASSAVQAGLDVVAVCDHNATENLQASSRAARPLGLTVIPGIEITSEEEVHILGLLPSGAAATRLQELVYRALPGLNEPEAFGLQVIANEDKEVLGFNERLLAGATQLPVEAVVEAIHGVGGVAVASHVDRETFGIIGQLGLIPPGLALDALEVSSRLSFSQARNLVSAHGAFPVLCSSDAHEPDQIGRGVTYMFLEKPTLAEIRRALEGAAQRAILGGGRPMEDLALHILDIAQNALEAGASRIEIEVVEDPARDLLTIQVRDNGRGMDESTVKAALDPFFTTRTTRRVGMGLPLLAQASRGAGGGLELESKPNCGTLVRATFRLSHIDRAPLGDLQTTLLVLVVGSPETEILFRHACGAHDFEFSSRDLIQVLGDRPLSSPEGLALFREVFEHGEAALRKTRSEEPLSRH